VLRTVQVRLLILSISDKLVAPDFRVLSYEIKSFSSAEDFINACRVTKHPWLPQIQINLQKNERFLSLFSGRVRRIT